jgi:hypothetical protein
VLEFSHFSRQKKCQCGSDCGDGAYLSQKLKAVIVRFLAECQTRVGGASGVIIVPAAGAEHRCQSEAKG